MLCHVYIYQLVHYKFIKSQLKRNTCISSRSFVAVVFLNYIKGIKKKKLTLYAKNRFIEDMNEI